MVMEEVMEVGYTLRKFMFFIEGMPVVLLT